MSKPRGSSKSWRERQESDPFVQRARREGWRSRAVFKLEELIDRRDLPGGQELLVVDLGAAPGGWSQFLHARLGERARIVAVDVLAMDEIPGVTFIEGDFTEQATLDRVMAALGGRRADLVMSDMAPNISGNRAVDQPRGMYLAELALDFAREVLRPGGTFVTKVFQGEGFDAFVSACRECFGTVRVRKPKASRGSSREVYVVARNYVIV